MAREVNLKVGIDARNAKKGATEFDRASNSIIKGANKVNSSFASLTKGVIGLSSAFLGFQTIKLATEAFITQEKAVNQLNAVLKATGGVVGRTSEQLQDMAKALQDVTTFGDEAIIEAQKIVLTFKGIRNEIFDRTIPAILDLSQVFGTDLKGQAIQVAKALEDPIKGLSALSRVGITFSQDQKDTIKALAETNKIAEAQTLILEALESQSKGAANAYRNTFGGSVIALNNAFGDLLETITSTSVETTGAVAVIQILERTIVKMSENINRAQGEISDFSEGVKVVFTVLTETLITVGRVIRLTLSTIVKETTTKIKTAIDLIKNFGIGSFKTLGLFIDTVQSSIVDGIQNILNGVAMLTDMDGMGRGDLTKYVDSLITSLDKFKKATTFNDDMDNIVKDFQSKSKKALNVVGADFKSIKNIVAMEFSSLSEIINETFDNYDKKTKEVNLKVTDIVEKSTTKQIESFSRLQNFIRDELFITTNVIQKFGDNFTDTLTDSLIDGKSKFKDFADFVIREMLRIQIKERITTPLVGALNSGLEAVISTVSGDYTPVPRDTGVQQTPKNAPKTSIKLSSQRGIKPSVNGSNITIINNTNSQVETRQRTDENGIEQIEFLIKNTVNKGFNDGDFDNSLSQFNISRN
jgi:hypothetical protein